MRPPSRKALPVTPRSMRRWILVLLLVAITPTALYEALQKVSEVTQPRRGILRLSARAEWETRWQATTGIRVVDHAVHEWRESARFYELAHRRLQEPRQRGRW